MLLTPVVAEGGEGVLEGVREGGGEGVFYVNQFCIQN